MITSFGIYSYKKPNSPRESKFPPFLIGVTVLLAIVGLTIALCSRKGCRFSPFLTHKYAKVTYSLIGCDYFVYCGFLIHSSRTHSQVERIKGPDGPIEDQPSANTINPSLSTHSLQPVVRPFNEDVLNGFLNCTLSITVMNPSLADNNFVSGPLAIALNDGVCPIQHVFNGIPWNHLRLNFNSSDLLSENAIHYYLDGKGYTIMNDLLRFSCFKNSSLAATNNTGVDMNTLVRKTVCTILSAASQLIALEPQPQPRTTYRKSFFLRKDLPSLYLEGQRVVEKGFFSTTKDFQVASCSRHENPDFVNVRFKIYGKSGRDVSNISPHKDEQEVLFLPYTTFQVFEVTDINGDYTVITLTEV